MFRIVNVSAPKQHTGTTAPRSLILALLACAGLLAACAGGGSYGRLVGASDAYSLMRQGSIGDDYRYYQTPDRARPNAIIAIRKEYTLDAGGDWTPVDLSTTWGVATYGMGSTPLLLEIQGPAGQHIGLWYSVWKSTVVKMEGDHRVQVYPPDVATLPGDLDDRDDADDGRF